MAFPVPRTLSPSKVTTFTDCALAFRFSAIDRLPEPPTVAATRGTLVHSALERLHLLPPADRTVDAALACLDEAERELRDHPDYVGLGLDDEQAAAFRDEAAALVRNYFRLEDPRSVRAIGLELMVEAEVDGVRLRGIIDRLELDEDGELVVTDYKTGSAPPTTHERKRLSGVHFYALLCEELLGRRPRTVQLLHLKEPLAISTHPTDRSTRGTRRTLRAVWQAVERACEREDFRPRRSALCGYCAFQAYCPVFGGDPDAARRLAEERAAEADGGGEGVPVAVGQAGAAGADDPAPTLAPLTPSPAS
ncbi:MAG: PD-(D/E)XK nuclease family protein [Thermoanaerobacterales bacterium]|jgi:putative RecB family exonuclease|nr:PD-(D/E)XK nuclease family protein [Thermoanaerobacterales bacterium]